MTSRKVTSTSFMSILRNGERVHLIIDGSGYTDPGVAYGAPENCYPPESEMVIDKITIESEDGATSPFTDTLTQVEEDDAIEQLWMDAIETHTGRDQNEEDLDDVN